MCYYLFNGCAVFILFPHNASLIWGEGNGEALCVCFAVALTLFPKNFLKNKRGVCFMGSDFEYATGGFISYEELELCPKGHDFVVSGDEFFEPDWELEPDESSRKYSVLEDEIERYLEEWRESLSCMCMLCGRDVDVPYKVIERDDIAAFCVCEGCWSTV